MEVRTSQRWRLGWFLVMMLLVPECTGHIRLTYPRARDYQFDFLDNFRTPGNCGMPPGINEHRINLQAGAELDVQWHLAYPHQGGYSFQLYAKNQTVVFRYPAQAGSFIGASDVTSVNQSLRLPSEPCDQCTLRMLRQALEWGRNYVFRSCADVNIVPVLLDSDMCSGHGEVQPNGMCVCDHLYVGDQCEFKDECLNDTDCGGPRKGMCVDIQATSYPKHQCYCAPGWFGTWCQHNSSVTERPTDMSIYTSWSPSTDAGVTIYHRVVEDEVEVVVRARTRSWMALGWRPPGLDKSCQNFPDTSASGSDSGKTTSEPEGEGETTSEPEGEGETTSEPEGEGETTSEPEGEGETTSEPEGEGETTSEPEGEGETTSEPEGEGETTSEPEGEGETTSEPEGEGETTSEPEGEGETTSEPEGEGETTSEPEGEGETTSEPEGEGEAMSEPEGEGEATSEPEGEGETRSEPEGEGEATSEPEGEGETRSEPEGEGEARSEPEGEGETTSEPEGEGEARSEPEGEGETTSEPEGEGEARSEPEGEGETTSEPEGEGEATSEPEGEGETTSEPEGEGEATSEPEGEGETTSEPEGEGEATSEPEGEGETTSEPEGEGEATSEPEGEGETTSEPEGEGETTSEPEGEGETTSEPEGEGETTSEPEGEGETTSEPEGEGETTSEPEGEGETTSEPEGEGETTSEPDPGPVSHPMDCTDIVVASARGNYSRIGDYYTRDRSTPVHDEYLGGENSLTAGMAWEEGNYTVMLFRKKLTSNDKADHSLKDEQTHVIWAMGQLTDFYKRDELKYHGRQGQRGTTSLNFYDKPNVTVASTTPAPATTVIPALKVGYRTPFSIRAEKGEFNPELNDVESSVFKRLASIFVMNVGARIQDFFSPGEIRQISVRRFRKDKQGGVIADMELWTHHDANVPRSTVEAEVRSAIRTSLSGLTIEGFGSIEVMSISAPVKDGEEVKDDDDDELTEVEIIIIAIVTALVLIAIIIGICKFVETRQSTNSSDKQSQWTGESNSLSNSSRESRQKDTMKYNEFMALGTLDDSKQNPSSFYPAFVNPGYSVAQYKHVP